MSRLWGLILIFFASSAFSAECQLQSRRKLPFLFVVAEGDGKTWKVEYGHDFSENYEKLKRARATFFKLGRLKNKPVFSSTFMSLNGDSHSQYYPNKKALLDKGNRIHGIYPEDLDALETNYRMMYAFYGDRLKNSVYFRLREMFFSSLKNPYMVRIWKEVYRKVEFIGLKNGNTIVRRFNNILAQVTRGRPELWSRVRMGTGFKDVKKIFNIGVQVPLVEKDIPIDHLKRVIEVFHHKLVDTVNEKYKSQFRYLNKRSLSKGGVQPYLDPVHKYLSYGMLETLKSKICENSSEDIVFLIVPENLHKQVLDLLKREDERIQYKVFKTLDEEDVSRMYQELEKRKVI